jgi:hypothetical protein
MPGISAYVSLIQQYGIRRCLYRFFYDLRKRSGILKWRFPTWAWPDRPLAYWLKPDVPSGPASYRQYRLRSPVKFLFPPGQPPKIEGPWAAHALAGAEELLAGKMQYFSSLLADVGGPDHMDWLRNPFTGQRSSADRHWCDYPIFDPLRGDVKYYWEPSRFCWVYPLVRAYSATHDDRYAEFFWRMLESWMASNPPNRGPNWACGQETSIRTLSCIVALYAFWNSPASTDERIASLACLIAGSAERVAKNVNFAIAQKGNHAASEAAGLFTIGMLFPEFRNSNRWRELGQKVLEDECRQFNWQDGSYIQHSMNYQRMTLRNYLWCIRLGQLNGLSFSDLVLSRMDKAWKFLYQLQDEDTGRVPNYGHNDSSMILPLNSCDYLDYRPLINSLHYCLHSTNLYKDGPWQEDLVWLFGPQALHAPSKSPKRKSSDFLIGGYHSLRGQDAWAMVRCHSYHSRPSQADMLHLDLWWAGVNVLRDSGTYSYYDPKENWHMYFTSTAAHNTVMVGGQDQMTKAGRFRWHTLLTSRFFGHIGRGPLELWQGEHYGYQRLPSKATHRRTVLRLGDAYWLIVDDILGQGQERTELFWHIPDLPVTQEDNRISLHTRAGPMTLSIWCNAQKSNLQVVKGQESPRRLGWDSTHYGQRTPAPTAWLECSGPLPMRCVTLVGLGKPCRVTECDPSAVIAWETEPGAAGARVDLAPPRADTSEVVRSVQFGSETAWRIPAWPNKQEVSPESKDPS